MMKALHKLAVVLIMILLLGGCQERSAAYNKIDRLINERFPADGPGVAVFVAAPGLGRQQFAAGLSDVAENKAMRSDDPFRIGALTQAFTSTLILQLIEQGTVALDDTLEKWLPVDLLDTVPNGRSVTIRQLLTMTSGIPDYQNHPGFQTAVAADPQRLWQPEEILAFSAHQTPDFAPGERFGYSAANYVLLQMVAETVTGESLAFNFRERFFYRLNMDNSYLEREEALPEGHVPGYTTANGTAEIVSGKRDGLGLGSDGIVAPVSDLRRFAPALATAPTHREQRRRNLPHHRNWRRAWVWTGHHETGNALGQFVGLQRRIRRNRRSHVVHVRPGSYARAPLQRPGSPGQAGAVGAGYHGDCLGKIKRVAGGEWRVAVGISLGAKAGVGVYRPGRPRNQTGIGCAPGC
jgi:CubicO group peptidase (beta-lactamase class C family)